MAITRRQFVTRLGALAAAAGFSQVEASKIMDAVAYDPNSGVGSVYQGTFGKPRVVWLHGAECTGCSTSLLGLYEKASGVALDMYSNPLGVDITTAAALTASKTLPVNNAFMNNVASTTLTANKLSPEPANASSLAVLDIADVVIDVIDLLYHETVMGMGGDLAYKWLMDFASTNGNTKPFVLVVEGALQATGNKGAWGGASSDVPWCSIAHSDTPGKDPGSSTDWYADKNEIVPAEIVQHLGESVYCVAIIAIGQCAAFGGYPGCKPPISKTEAGFDTTMSQTNALGVYDFLVVQKSAAADKVVNSPGCPTNPWWFVLTVVALIVDIPSVFKAASSAVLLPNSQAVGTVGTLGVLKTVKSVFNGAPDSMNGTGIGVNPAAVDGTRRLRPVYTNNTVHGPLCSKYRYYTQGVFATHPGGNGCLQKIGCKGAAAHSLCTVHGWNNQQPENVAVGDALGAQPKANTSNGNVAPYEGGNCTRAGHPCMACTEKGYPDSYVPFVTGF